MKTTINREAMVRDLVIEIPRSDELFKQYRIDFCCGGKRPLNEVIAEKNLDEATILQALQTLFENAKERSENDRKDWTTASYGSLINHVVKQHHGYLAEELPDLSFYVTKIFRVHGSSHPELKELHTLFHHLKLELEQHMVKEEQIVFPAIYQYEQSQTQSDYDEAVKRIDELEAEHEAAGSLLKKIRHITNDFTLPEGACTTYKLTFTRLEALESDMFQHIHLENNILFPQLKLEFDQQDSTVG
ncbi:iron-sulfur cluster repair di-iron protein [Salipaludibacillus keqinensis]|uniref:Iron-sulfur cluster repair di-iron protein n=1 Tax=Salipaludibacillus keqinensis TaxID=2045207 RepID=A0A323TK28_9BACI|nr:iron-sulfur cluster repair di-iron protein [Salipaludibacillus keqinensis]PYZ95248.1 iron-sulfur cluster repair di-iron protein [Salipaludibacillus keqinensis]